MAVAHAAVAHGRHHAPAVLKKSPSFPETDMVLMKSTSTLSEKTLESNDVSLEGNPAGEHPTNGNNQVSIDALYAQMLHDKQHSMVSGVSGVRDERGSHLFVDADMMKQQLKEKLLKKDTYDVMDYYKKIGLAQKIARHFMFETVTLAVIAMNGFWISIDTDLNTEPTLLDAHPVFVVAENFFCFYFSMELLIRFVAFKLKRNCLRDAWFVFDSVLVATMVLETWVMTAIMLMTGTSGSSSLSNASILRMARLLRLTRMARMARLLRAMPELVILVKGMVAAMRSVVFTLVLLGMIIYIFAIAFRQVTDDTPIGDTYFETVPKAMGTLLNRGAFIDELSQLAEDITNEEPWLLVLLYAFVLLASLTLMNMLVGVLVEVVQAVASTEKEALTISYVRERLESIIRSTDLYGNNDDGLISKDEFMLLLNNNRASATLASVDVDVVNLVDAADFIFQSDMVDESGNPVYKRLTFHDFMELILSLRGSNTATVRDIVDLRKFVTQEFKKMELRTTIRNNRISDFRALDSRGTPTVPTKRTSVATNASRWSSEGHEKEAREAIFGISSGPALRFENPHEQHNGVPSVSHHAQIKKAQLDKLQQGERSKFDSLHVNAGDEKSPKAALNPEDALAKSARELHSARTARSGKRHNSDTILRDPSASPHTSGNSTHQDEHPEALKRYERLHQIFHANSTCSELIQLPRSWEQVSLIDDYRTKGMLAHPASSSFRRCAEVKFQRLLLELEEHHETALAELRSENSRLLEELSTIWHASVWHVPDTEASPAVEPFRELY